MIESRGGEYVRHTGSREDLRIEFEKELTYADGSSSLVNVTVTSTNRADGRTFTVTGKDGRKQDNPESYVLDGDVQLVGERRPDRRRPSTRRTPRATALSARQGPSSSARAGCRAAGRA